MKKTVYQIIILFVLVSLCLSTYLLMAKLLELPFRPTNDGLHKKDVGFNLDFLIPSSTHLDDKITIGEVIKIRISKESPLYDRALRSFFDLIPLKYRYLADSFLFLFWFFCFMTFMRVFTFVGYGRCLRWSLYLGGLTYYFIPDFSPGRIDDIFFIALPLTVFVFFFFRARKSPGG